MGFRLRDYRTQELVGQVRQMKAKVAAMEGETVEWTVQEQRQVDALKKRTQELLKKLVVATETLQSELQELSSSLNYNLARGGAAALMEPSTKFRHDQLLNEITVLERRAREDCGEAVGLVERLMEFTYGQPDVTTKESDDETPVYRPKSPDQQFFRQQRVIDREARVWGGAGAREYGHDASRGGFCRLHPRALARDAIADLEGGRRDHCDRARRWRLVVWQECENQRGGLVPALLCATQSRDRVTIGSAKCAASKPQEAT